MIAAQGVLAVAFFGAGFAAWWLLRHSRISSGQAIVMVVTATWATASAVVWWRGAASPATDLRAHLAFVQSRDSLAWPETLKPRAPSAPLPAAEMQAGSVESLVGGLEARLAAQPGDANGWALLAQSYAFTANEEAAERAVQRAVALGFDERTLRDRVASAQRSAPVGDWFERVMPPKGP